MPLDGLPKVMEKKLIGEFSKNSYVKWNGGLRLGHGVSL